jgi:hypothetical protein
LCRGPVNGSLVIIAGAVGADIFDLAAAVMAAGMDPVRAIGAAVSPMGGDQRDASHYCQDCNDEDSN